MIYVILLIALILRLVLINQSLWLDEAINVVYSTRLSFLDFVFSYTKGDFHPPLHFAILWFTSNFLGTTEWIVRLPAVLFGVLSVLLVYKIAKDLFDKKIGIFSSLLLTFSPLHIYYSQEARMYSLSVFVVLVSYWFFNRLIQGKKYSILGYSLSLILVFYTEYVAYFALLPQIIYTLIYHRKILMSFVISWFMAILSFIPWLPFFLPQLQTGQQTVILLKGWGDVVGGNSLKDFLLFFAKTFFGRISFENKYFYGLSFFGLVMIYGLLIFKGLKKVDSKKLLILFWFVIPLTGIFLFSFYLSIFSYFRVIFLLPPLYILLSLGILSFKKKASAGLLVFFLIVQLSSLVYFWMSPQFQREDWKTAVKTIEEVTSSDGGKIFFENDRAFAPYEYYANSLNSTFGGIKYIPADSDNDLIDDQILIRTGKIYLFEYLVDVHDPRRLLPKKLIDLGFTKSGVLNFNGVGFVHIYEK